MLTLRSDAFNANGVIPERYTCDGLNQSPPLDWSGVPEGTRSLVLIIDDPDAPDPRAPQRTWVHWVLYNLPPTTNTLPAGVVPQSLPHGAAQGVNDGGRMGYSGPCPPVGKHRYFHKLYAIDTILNVAEQPNKAAIELAMRGHIIAKAELIGVYAARQR